MGSFGPPMAPLVLPPSEGGLHCGNVLNSTSPMGPMVLPSFNGGLHCGNRYPDPEDVYGGWCSCRPTAAPLRPRLGDAMQRGALVLPAIKGGLHCGAEQIVQTEALRQRAPAA